MILRAWIAGGLLYAGMAGDGLAQDSGQAGTPPQAEAGQVGPGASPGEQAQDPITPALATLLDAGQSEAVRLEAARTLASGVTSPNGRAAVFGVLSARSGDASALGLMLRALAREAVLPEELLPALTDLAGSVDGDRLARVLMAAGAIRSPESLRLVARFLDSNIPDAARNAALASLVRATGREDLPPTPAAWLRWIDGVLREGESGGPAWDVVLLRGVAERVDRLNARSRDISTRLIDSERRLYVLTPPGQQGAALAAMISDDLAEVRGVGFELLERELVTSPSPAPEVVRALLGLLSHPLGSVRAQAAVFVGRIAPEGAGEAVATALTFEKDPVAAGALLAAAARWPTEQIHEPVLRWLENGPVNRPVAANTALAMLRAGAWSDEDQVRLSATMRAVPQGELSPQGCRLIAAIGTDEDRRRLSELLTGGSAVQRLAVADALTARPEFVDAILTAASRDTTLIPAASRAVAAHRATIEGFRQVAGIPCGDEQVRRVALRIVGEALPAGALLFAADETGGDTATTQWLLERARTLAQQQAASGDGPGAALLDEAAERLARLHLELGRPAEAIAALDAVPSGPTDSRFNPIRTVALVVLDRLPEAEALGCDVAVWLDALERAIELPHAAEVLRIIDERFGSTLSPAQSERLAGLRVRLRQARVPDGPG